MLYFYRPLIQVEWAVALGNVWEVLENWPTLSSCTVKLLLQAEERGVVSIKGVCANRFLAMTEDGRLSALVSIILFGTKFSKAKLFHTHGATSLVRCSFLMCQERAVMFRLPFDDGRPSWVLTFSGHFVGWIPTPGASKVFLLTQGEFATVAPCHIPRCFASSPNPKEQNFRGASFRRVNGAPLCWP